MAARSGSASGRRGSRRTSLSSAGSSSGAELGEAARCVRRLVGARGVVRLYGELFGGSYPHPDVAPVAGMSAVLADLAVVYPVAFAALGSAAEEALAARVEAAAALAAQDAGLRSGRRRR